MSIRTERVNSEIQKALADIFRNEMDGRIANAMISVLRVDTSKDLFQCKVLLSIFGCENKAAVFESINKSSSFIRHKLSGRMNNLRVTPELVFSLDDSLEYSQKINSIINKINDK